MHEASLMADLIRRILAIAAREQATKVTRVNVTLGALSHLSSAHVRDHFAAATRGTIAEGARLDLALHTDITAPDAQELWLSSIDVET